MIYLGVNTGTSADAVDCAAFEISQEGQKFLDGFSIEMPKKIRSTIIKLVESNIIDVDKMEYLKHQLTEVYVEAVNGLLRKKQWQPDQVRAIGLHGQTIHHKPDIEYPYTIQLGCACKMASQVGIEVVDRFREIDIALGGQGAPLIPVYHQYLLKGSPHDEGVFLNLGGIANVTVVGRKELYGWDIGPANALMDLWAQGKFQQPYDENGEIARSGRVIQSLLDDWLADPYFQKACPKSTGRDYFSRNMLEKVSLDKMSLVDVMATCCELTARTISVDLKKHADTQAKKALFLYGKGVANGFLLERLEALMPAYEIESCDGLGVDPDWLEAGLFAWLAYCHVQKIALDLTNITGADRPAILGSSVPVI